MQKRFSEVCWALGYETEYNGRMIEVVRAPLLTRGQVKNNLLRALSSLDEVPQVKVSPSDYKRISYYKTPSLPGDRK